MQRTLFLLAFAACDSHGHSQQCNPDGTCSNGLVCIDNHCLAFDTLPPGDSTPPFDGVPACADDSALEPNDTITNAFVTSVDEAMQMISIAGLSTCPQGDKDTYQIRSSTANKAVDVTITWTSGPALSLSILNAGGTAIVNGTPIGGTSVRACAPNLPIGTYFAQAFGPPNNYSMSIRVAPSCI